MNDVIILLVILCFLLYALFRHFSSHIEIVQTGAKSFKVLLYYSVYNGNKIKRKYIKLFEYEQR